MSESVKRFSALRNIFCFTPRGVLFLAFSSAVFVNGLLRADLASLLWASGFLLICAYSLAANNLLRIVSRRYLCARADSYNLALPARGVFPGRPARASLTLKLPRPTLPGFSADFFLRLTWQDAGSCELRRALPPGESAHELRFIPPARGEYAGRFSLVTISDLPGLTRSMITLPHTERLTVYPVLTPGRTGDLKLEVEGADIQYAPRKKQSDDLLEARKYYPGDDVRRINWKMFARFRELYLRIGEETSLPRAKLLCIIDPTTSALVPGFMSHAYLDRLVERAGSLLLSLLHGGIDLWLWTPELAAPKSLDPRKPEILFDSLVRIWWQPGFQVPSLPARRNLHALVFSCPGSFGLEPLLQHLRRAGLKTSLFFPLWRQEAYQRPRLTLRRLLFRDAGPGEDRDDTGTRGASPGIVPGQTDPDTPIGSAAAPDARPAGSKAAETPIGSAAAPDALPAGSKAAETRRAETAAFIEAVHQEAARFRAAPWRIRDVYEV
jgi:uncharacterized protein (DUF58 family)